MLSHFPEAGKPYKKHYYTGWDTYPCDILQMRKTLDLKYSKSGCEKIERSADVREQSSFVGEFCSLERQMIAEYQLLVIYEIICGF